MVLLYLIILLNIILIIIGGTSGSDDNVLESDYYQKVYFQGDIIIPISGRSSVTYTGIWEKGIIPYVFEANVDENLKTQVENAMQSYSTLTDGCIKFIERTTEDDYILIVANTNRCAANPGRWGGRQAVHFAYGCRNKRTILHELLHVLGFVHEHSRTDRDEFVTIVYDNILDDQYREFEIDLRTETLDVPYDYESILHYGQYHYSKNGKPTIITLDPTYQNIIGNLEDPSEKDILKIKRKYHCGPRRVVFPSD